MVDLTIEESISKLKINLIRRRPFYGVILMKLGELKESDTTDIASTETQFFITRNIWIS